MHKQPRRQRAGLARRRRRRRRRFCVVCIAARRLLRCCVCCQAALPGGPQQLCNLPQLGVVHFYGVFVCNFRLVRVLHAKTAEAEQLEASGM